MARVLIVDDDPGVADMLSLALTSLGHETTRVGSGQAALDVLQGAHGIDVCLLDVMMPGIDGFETCRAIRRRDGLPIIMLTARTDAVDIVAGLECGADDYVGKPAEPRVLDARIKALLRRSAAEESPRIIIGDLEIDEFALLASRGGQELSLTATEFKLLLTLARNAGQVLTRAVLLDRVWDYGFAADSRIVDAAVQRLRAKLEPDPSRPTYLHTLRGFGYRLDVPR